MPLIPVFRDIPENNGKIGLIPVFPVFHPSIPGKGREFYFRPPGLKRAGEKIAEAKIRETAGILIIGFVLIKKERITTRDIINQQSLQRKGK